MFVAEGIKIIDELLKSDFKIKKIYLRNNWKNTDLHNHAESKKVEIVFVSDNDFLKLSNQATPEGALALVEIPKNFFLLKEKNILALCGINDPGNFGTLIRLADWFAIEDILISENTVDPYNPKVVQAAKGSLFRVRIHECKLSEVLSSLSTRINLLGADTAGENINTFQNKQNQFCLVMGSESHGIDTDVRKHLHHIITIPSYKEKHLPQAESLNVAMSAGIILSRLLN